jgi:hypothetical protein
MLTLSPIYIKEELFVYASHLVLCIAYIVKGGFPLKVDYTLDTFWSLVHNNRPFMLEPCLVQSQIL